MGDSFIFDFALEGHKAYVPYSLYAFDRGVSLCLDKGFIKNGFPFLDLGAGKGRVVQEAARFGFFAYGIEYHEQHTSDAEKAIAEARRSRAIGESSICRVVQGSYYSHDYIALRDSGTAIALQYEDRFFNSANGDIFSFDAKTRSCVFYPVASPLNPFDELGITFRHISLFFSYTWGLELPSQLEMFSRYASPHAVFLNESAALPERQKDLLGALSLEQQALGVSIHPILRFIAGPGLVLYKKKA